MRERSAARRQEGSGVGNQGAWSVSHADVAYNMIYIDPGRHNFAPVASVTDRKSVDMLGRTAKL